MKLYTKNSVVMAEAETIDDVKILMGLTIGDLKNLASSVGKKSYLRTCDICGGKFRGAQGISIHKYKTHKISKNGTTPSQE